MQMGSVQLFVDEGFFGASVVFEKETKGVIEMPDFSAAMTAASHSITLKMTDGSKMPFTLKIVYNTLLPVSIGDCELGLQTRLM